MQEILPSLIPMSRPRGRTSLAVTWQYVSHRKLTWSLDAFTSVALANDTTYNATVLYNGFQHFHTTDQNVISLKQPRSNCYHGFGLSMYSRVSE